MANETNEKTIKLREIASRAVLKGFSVEFEYNRDRNSCSAMFKFDEMTVDNRGCVDIVEKRMLPSEAVQFAEKLIEAAALAKEIDDLNTSMLYINRTKSTSVTTAKSLDKNKVVDAPCKNVNAHTKPCHLDDDDDRFDDDSNFEE